MPPPPTPSPSTSNTMPPPSGYNTMPPPPTPSGSNTMSSHTTAGSNTSTCSNTMPSHAASASTGTNKGKSLLIPKKEADLPKVVLLAKEVVLGVVQPTEVVLGMVQPAEVVLGVVQLAEDESSDEEHQFKMDMKAVCNCCKKPMIEDEPLQVGVDLPTQESTVEANPKRTRSKKSKAAEVPNQMRIFHKNRGIFERIFNQKMKNFKFDKNGTGSTPDKAFDVECYCFIYVFEHFSLCRCG
ncbi:hypothetical protein Tco_0091640 [Tanacetum coccineum]